MNSQHGEDRVEDEDEDEDEDEAEVTEMEADSQITNQKIITPMILDGKAKGAIISSQPTMNQNGTNQILSASDVTSLVITVLNVAPTYKRKMETNPTSQRTKKKKKKKPLF